MVCWVNLPGSCRVLGGHWGRESGYGERHKSVEDGASEIAEHRSAEVGRWEWPHGGMPRVQPGAARTADEWLSPPSADGGDRRKPPRSTHPSFPGLALAFSQF